MTSVTRSMAYKRHRVGDVQGPILKDAKEEEAFAILPDDLPSPLANTSQARPSQTYKGGDARPYME